jgi:hypothetical protein
MKRKLLVVLAVLVAAGVVALILTWANLGKIVKFGVEEGGSLVLGVPVTLKKATVSVSTGTVGLDGLTIGSPKGFSAPNMFELDHASATVDIGSLRSNQIVVKDVTVDRPRITLEFGGGTTNWSTLMARLQKPPSPEEQAKQSKKQMRIAHLSLSNGKVSIAGIPVAGQASVPLPGITMNDIGGSAGSGGSSIRTVIADVFTKLYTGILDAAKSVVPTEQLQKLGTEALSTLGQTGSEAKGAAGEAVGAVKGLFGGGQEKKPGQ